MKRNKIMALTALLTLIGAPLSKAQETKGGSQQSTSAQSANKDSKAVDKTKDSKAPQQNKDSKTAEKTKEETKKDSKNAQQMKEQPKDSKKDGKKENKKSDVASNETLLNRMVNLGYSLEWIKKNWPWLAAIGGTGVVSGVAGNKMGKNSVVDDEVNKKVQQKINLKILNNELLKKVDVDANYIKNDNDAIKQKAVTLGMIDGNDANAVTQAAVNFGIKYTEEQLNNLVENAKKKVDDEWKQKIDKGELLENVDEDAIKKLADGIGLKYTEEDLANKVKNGELFTKDDVQNNYKKNADFAEAVKQEIDKKISNKELVKTNDGGAIKQAAAEKFGIKYTDNDLKQKINAAVSSAKSNDLLTRVVDENKKDVFDNSIKKIDKKLLNSLKVIQTRLNGNFADILVETEYGSSDKEVKIDNKTIVGALSMLADIKNALVDKQALNFEAKFTNSEGKTNDGSWSDFYFNLGSKKYNVYILHTNGQIIYVTDDGGKNRYCIPLE